MSILNIKVGWIIMNLRVYRGVSRSLIPLTIIHFCFEVVLYVNKASAMLQVTSDQTIEVLWNLKGGGLIFVSAWIDDF